MITLIDNYAITSGMPGVIQEDAYTTLELVGKCGAKVNECITEVNTLESDVERTETKAELARTVAQESLRRATTAEETIADIDSRNGYMYNVFAFNSCILNIKEIGADEYTDVFIEYINEFIAKVLNEQNIYFNFETERFSNPITVHVAWGDPFNQGGNLENTCVTGTLDFSIFGHPAIEILPSENPLITWQFTQTPVILNSEASGTIDSIYANGCTFFESDNYNADNPYDGQLFGDSRLGAFIDNGYQI